MKKIIPSMMCAVLVIALLSACAPAAPTEDPGALATIVAQSVQLTQLSASLTEVVAKQSATPAVTKTPFSTATLTMTPTITMTPTQESGLWLTFDQNTNCRYGPGTSFSIAALVEAGTKLQAIAQSEDGEFYYVRYFDTSNHYCWVWKQTAYQSGTTNVVPVYTTVPSATPSITPTAAAGFTVSYKSLQSCSGKYYLLLSIKNTGYLTWQSIKITATDNTNNTTVTHSSDNFTAYAACGIGLQQGDLTTNEPGDVATYNPGEFSYDPTGHNLTVTISLFSEKGNAGTVVTKTIAVNP